MAVLRLPGKESTTPVISNRCAIKIESCLIIFGEGPRRTLQSDLQFTAEMTDLYPKTSLGIARPQPVLKRRAFLEHKTIGEFL